MTLDTEQLTPEELRSPLLKAMLPHIAFDGWSSKSVKTAAEDLGISPELAELAFPRGAIEILELYLVKTDATLRKKLLEKGVSNMRIRDGITTAVRTKLEIIAHDRELERRSVATLALPHNIALGTKTLWQNADTMWKAVGDTSTDHNWYTKRATLSAVYSTVLLFWLNDDSDDYADTWAFLDRRIENVMTFEKTKFQVRNALKNVPSLSRFLGRLRYPSL